MWNLLTVRTGICKTFASDLQDAADRLPPANTTREVLRAELSAERCEHLEHCANCRVAFDDLLAVRHSLEALRINHEASYWNDPWFATQVIRRIGANERAAEFGNSTWRAVPRVASRMAGVAAVFLLLAGTWVARNRPAISNDSSANMNGVENLFDSAQPVATHEDPLAGVLGRDR